MSSKFYCNQNSWSCGRGWGRGTLITDATLPVQNMTPKVWLAVPCPFLHPLIRACEGPEAEGS